MMSSLKNIASRYYCTLIPINRKIWSATPNTEYRTFDEELEDYTRGIENPLPIRIARTKKELSYKEKLIQGITFGVEDLHLIIHSFTKCDTWYDVIHSFKLTYRIITGSNVISDVLQRYLDNEKFLPQGDAFKEFLQACRNAFTVVDGLKSNIIFKRFEKILCFTISYGIMDRLGVNIHKSVYSEFELNRFKKEKPTQLTFAMTILETALYCMEVGYDCFTTGIYSPLIHSVGNYNEWVMRCLELQRDYKYLANPKPLGFTVFEYLKKLEKVLEDGQTMMKYNTFQAGSIEFKMLGKMYVEMIALNNDYKVSIASASIRKAPFAVVIEGITSQGKVTFVEQFHQHFCKVRGLPLGPEYRYYRNPLEKHWNGYDSSKIIIHLDDMSAQNPSLGQPDPSIAEGLNLKNNSPYGVEQAALDKKGMTPVNIELLTASTNVGHLNAFHNFSAPIAFLRRWDFFISIKAKDEYCTNGMLDGTKFVRQDGHYEDLWIIKVKKVVPTNVETSIGDMGRFIELRTFDSFNDFCDFMTPHILQHNTLQERIVDNVNRLQDVLPCDSCKMMTCKCSKSSLDNVYNGQKQTQMVDDFFHFIKVVIALLGYRVLCVTLFYFSLYWCTRAPIIHWISWWTGFEQWLGGKVFIYTDMTMRAGTRFMVDTMFNNLVNKTRKYYGYLKKPEWMMISIGVLSTASTAFAVYKLCKQPIEVNVDVQVENVLEKTMEDDDDINLVLSSINSHKKEIDKLTKSVENLKNRRRFREIKKVDTTLQSSDDIPTDDESDPSAFYREVITQLREEDVEIDLGTKPVPLEVEKINEWKNNDLYVSKFEITDQSKSLAKKQKNEVIDILKNNVVRIFLFDGEGIQRSANNATCVAGNYYLTNTHFTELFDRYPDGHIELIDKPRCSRLGVYKLLVKNLKQRILHEGSDITLLTIEGIPPKRDIRKFFVEQYCAANLNGYILIRNNSGDLHSVDFKCLHNVRYINVSNDFHLVANGVGTIFGDCGSMWVAHSNAGPAICGIHVAACEEDKTVLCNLINQSVLSTFNLKRVVDIGQPYLSAPGYERQIVPVHHKAPLNFMTNSICNVYGGLTGARAHPKSKVQNTLLYDAMSSKGYVCEYGPPVMKGWEVQHINLDPMVHKKCLIDIKLLDQVTQDLKNHFDSNMTSEDYKQIHVLDYDTAINGSPGVAFIDSINRSSSAGNPYKKTKKFFLEPVWKQDFDASMDELKTQDLDKVQLVDFVMQRVIAMDKQYSSGKRCYANFCAHLKDEPRSFKKIAELNTRSFSGAPLEYVILMRKYYLSITRWFQLNKFVSCMAVGTQCQNIEWEQIYLQYLKKHPTTRCVAGDYKHFDKTQEAVILQRAFDIMYHISEKSGFSNTALKALDALAVDTIYALMEFDGTLIEFIGCNPSGHPLTVIVNCLVNVLYNMYAYAARSPDGTAKDFFEYVSLMTYGDDDLKTISEECTWFDQITMSQEMAKIGVTYTNADKSSVMTPFIDLDKDATFLKRRWRYDDNLKHYVCPLEEESIIKMLMVGIPSPIISDEAQCVEKVGSALREYFWYGKDKYIQKEKELKMLLDECNLQEWITSSTFPGYDNMARSYFESSRLEIPEEFLPKRPVEEGLIIQTKIFLEDEVTALSTKCRSLRRRRAWSFSNHLPERSSKSLLREVRAGGQTTFDYHDVYELIHHEKTKDSLNKL